MKKIINVLLVTFVLLASYGCSTKEKDDVVGGWSESADESITPELKEMFETAMDGLLGASYEPVKLVSTQVVAGTNYKFLANGTKTTNPVTKGTYYVTIYKDLNGNVKLLDIEVIEEKQG